MSHWANSKREVALISNQISLRISTFDTRDFFKFEVAVIF